jgi:nucleotide-binding universal stress UspA family protein
MFRNLLVAYDGSPTAARALAEAADLALAANARLTIVSVIAPMASSAYRAGVDVGSLEKDVEAQTDRELRGAVDALPQDLPVTTVIRRGHPGEEIVKQIEAGRHDLLVMGTRGRGRVSANLFGSVAAHVHYQHGHIAMLVVHPDQGER